MNQPDVLKMLPYHITLYPTVLAFVPGNYPDIFPFTRRNPQIALKKFIDANIIQHITMVNHNEFFNYVNKWNQEIESPEPRKPQIIHITNKDQTPIVFKYASFKLNDFFEFYQNVFGEANKVK